MINHTAGLPQPGDVIAGKYQVEQVLGAGGMGVVVRARHVALRQAVAVKFLLPQALKLQGASERFLREAQASVAITSEHVARVLDVGTLQGGAPYMVMECLSGMDLGKALKQHGTLPIAEAVDFVLQAGEAIAEAHTLGIVHRDLKPSNIFLTRRAEGSALVKVLDFGLSKMTAAHGGGDHSLTATDVVAGSPDYMSPEQVRSLKNVDGRTDLWSLGVVLYELLTGKRPFHGPTPAAICASVAADKPLPVRALRADVPEGLDRAILRCLEKDPGSRPQNMGELALSLAPFAPPESRASIDRIVRLTPRGAPGSPWGDGSESVTMPLGAPGAAPPQPPAPQNTPSVAAGSNQGMHAASAPTFAAMAVTGQEPSLGERAALTPTLTETGATHPSGPTGGWGQTRPPSPKGSILAIGGAAAAAIVAVAVVIWQVAGAGGATAEAGSTAASSAAGALPGESAVPVPATPSSVTVVPNVPVAASAVVSATPEAPAPAPVAPSSSVAITASSQTAVAPASPSASSAPKAQGTSAGPKSAPGKPPPKPTATTVLDKPL